MEELYESNHNARDRDELQVLPNGTDATPAESTEVSKSTTETLMAGERILEALTISALDRQLIAAHEEELVGLSKAARKKIPRPPRNPVFEFYGGVGAEEYVLMVVRRVPAAGLHDALLVLPFGKVIELIEHLDFWALKVRYAPLTSDRPLLLPPITATDRELG